MKNQTKYDLKRARRRFAAKFLFTPEEAGLIEGGNDVIELVSVTDTANDPMASFCASISVDPDSPSILVGYKPGTVPTGPNRMKSFPRRYDGYPVYYYLHSVYETWLRKR